MPVDVGIATVSTDGTVVKSGLAGAYFDAIFAEESTTLPDRDRPTSTFTGSLDAWRQSVDKATTNMKKVWARTAREMAKAFVQGVGTELTTSDASSVIAGSYGLPGNCLVLFDVTVTGHRRGVDPATAHAFFRSTASASRFGGGTAVFSTNAPALVDILTSGSATVSVGCVSFALVVNVQGEIATTWEWRTQITPIHVYVYG